MENLNLLDPLFERKLILPWVAQVGKGVRSTVVEGVDSVDHQLEKTVSKVRAGVQDRYTDIREAVQWVLGIIRASIVRHRSERF